MAGKGKKTSSGRSVRPDYFPPEILGVKTAGIGKGWESAKMLFDYRKAEDALKGMLQFADMRLAVALFLVGGLLGFLFTVLANFVLFYVQQIKSDVIGDIIGEQVLMPDISIIMHPGLANLLLFVPFALVLNLAFERGAFAMIKVTGGKGTLEQHLLLASVVWIAMNMTFAANLLGPFEECLNILSVFVIVVIGVLYLMMYTNAKAYSIAHSIGMGHALLINILLILPRIVIWFYMGEAATAMLSPLVSGV